MALKNFGRVLFCIMAFMPLIYGQKLDKCFTCPSSSTHLLPFNSSVVDFEACVNSTTTETKVECDAGVKTNLSDMVFDWTEQKNGGKSRIEKNNETVSVYRFPIYLLTVGPETSSDATNASSTTPSPTIATTATNPEYCFNMLINFDAEKIYAVQCLKEDTLPDSNNNTLCKTYFDSAASNQTYTTCPPPTKPVENKDDGVDVVKTGINITAPNITAPNVTTPNSLTPTMPPPKPSSCCGVVTMIVYKGKDCSSPTRDRKSVV